MDLDFSAFDKLGTDIPNDTKKIRSIETEKIKEADPEISKLSAVKLNAQQEEHKQIAMAYKAYQDNIKKSGDLRSRMLAEARSGSGCQALLLLAIECIKCMTDDNLFYNEMIKMVSENQKE